jgi:catechol 2,3-dioxygenase-like lactoylglutathione lyase family enzyme
MQQAIIHVALLVRDYDEALDFYCRKLNFKLVEDTYQPEQDKRWVVISPAGFHWHLPASGQSLDRSPGTVHR